MSLLLLLQPAAAQATTGTASFAQPAASWGATLSEALSATGTFGQAATWGAAGSERLTASGAFAQAATWTAQAKSLQPATGTATFGQTAAWAGVAIHTDISVQASASFTQARVMAGVTGTVKLKIMGYASRVMPSEYAQATAKPIDLEGGP